MSAYGMIVILYQMYTSDVIPPPPSDFMITEILDNMITESGDDMVTE
jgi:hypothetical protein